MHYVIPIGIIGLIWLLSRAVKVKERPKKLKPAIDPDIESAVNEELAAMLPSPIGGVTDGQWSEFVRRSKVGRIDTISSSYGLGYFLMDMRQLQELGYVKNVTQVDYAGKKVWNGDWIEPYSLEMYLSNAKLQYEVFVRVMLGYMQAIKSKYAKYLHAQVEGQHKTDAGVISYSEKISMSGLMGAAHRAGLAGLGKWLEGDRKPSTTEAFLRFNGLFL